MYECIRPTQFIKEYEKDYISFKGDKCYVHAKWGYGKYEISKEEFEKLESRGMRAK